jgi:hypothetical protein
MAIEPFQISPPDLALDKVRERLSFVEFTDELDDARGNTGMPLADMRRLVSHWRQMGSIGAIVSAKPTPCLNSKRLLKGTSFERIS